ncbi:MAG: XdhC family protein [Pseudomonadota bacterium]
MPDDITYLEHAQDVLEKATDLIAQGEPFTLVTSIAIKGGTARELGSLALVTASGEMIGYLSNGCIDQDIRLNAQRCLESNERKIVHYGEGSPFPDLTLPCGGMLKVLLDPKPDPAALKTAYRKLAARTPAQLCFDTGGTSDLLTVEYAPKPKIVLAGRGAVFRATANMAGLSGFEVHCMSPDDSDVAAVGSSGAYPVQHLLSPNATPECPLDEWSAFLTLFHDHSWEPFLLQSALRTNCRFVGALGSQRTHEARKAVLRGMGCSPTDIDRIHGPVGLVSSLRSADLIAVAVVAELAASFSRSQRQVATHTSTDDESAMVAQAAP